MAFISQPIFELKAYQERDTLFDASLAIDDWDVRASAYKEAGDSLIEHISEGTWHRDALAFPILFLYRHYLELRIKELILAGAPLVTASINVSSLFQQHDLLHLWTKLRPILEALWDDPQSKAHDDAVEARIKEMNAIDSRSISFRYPTDRSGRRSITGLPYLNLRHVKDVIQAMSNVLDGASIGIDEARRTQGP